MSFPWSVSYVQAQVDGSKLGPVLNPIIDNIVYPVIQLLFGLAVVFFVWGVLQMIFHGEDEEARKKGRDTLLWGTLGLFIMVSAWGIIYFVSDTIKSL